MTSPTLLPELRPKSLPARESAFRRLGIPLVLFFITLFSTTAVGMRYMHNFRLGGGPLATDADILPFEWVFGHLSMLATGLPFSLTLIAILLTHEFGHFFACRAYAVRCTLPYMLPAPSLSGTFGAVIRLRSSIRSRAALIVIGASGPIAGVVTALGAAALGLRLSTYSDIPVVRGIQPPLALFALHRLLSGSAASTQSLRFLVPHPVLIASWIGLLITALNLIPAGQLDGGHIAYAISPQVHRWSSRIVIAALLLFGIFFWSGWLLWGIILMMPAMRHPRVPDATPIARRHLALIPLCALIFLFCGTFQPFRGYSILDVVHRFSTHPA